VTDLATGERSEIRRANLKIREQTNRSAPITEIEVRSEGATEGR
jgi:hypothetical protein